MIDLNPVTGLAKGIMGGLDSLFTSDEERLEQENILKRTEYLEHKLVSDENIAQMQINLQDAKSSNWFQAGWRPFIAWTIGLIIFYNGLGHPMLSFIFGADKLPPLMDASQLYPMIMGMLGIAGARSFDKFKGVDTRKGNSINTQTKSTYNKTIDPEYDEIRYRGR